MTCEINPTAVHGIHHLPSFPEHFYITPYLFPRTETAETFLVEFETYTKSAGNKLSEGTAAMIHAHAYGNHPGSAPVQDIVADLGDNISTALQSPGPHHKQPPLIPQPEVEGAPARDRSDISELTRSTEASLKQDLELKESRTPDSMKHNSHARNLEHQTLNSPPSRLQRKSKQWYFFYGSLMDRTQLQRVLGLRDRPRNLVPAEIVGYHVQMWGQHPALIDGPPGNVVKGMAYEVEGREDKDKLAAYETNNYKEHKCSICLEGGAQLSGTTFEWTGDMDELKDGSFDLKDWQMAHLLED